MAACVDCNLYNVCRNNKVDGKGNTNADIMIVSDAPSRVEDNFGGLMSGDTRQKLTYFLKSAGIAVSEVYFTTALRCKPRNLSDIKQKNIEACRKYLFHDIVTVRPKIIITMGKYAHMALTGQKSVVEFRGHFDRFKLNVGKGEAVRAMIMPTLSHNASMGKWDYDDYIIHDLRKAKEWLKTRKIPETRLPKFKTVLSLEDLKEFERVMMSKETKWATSDLETTGFKFFKDFPFMHGYCTNNNEIFCIPTLTYKKKHTAKWDDENKARAIQINKFVKKYRHRILETIKRVNARKDIKWVFHNGKFDLNFARYHGYPYSNLFFDTLLADSLVDENKMHSLNICMEYRGINFGAYDTLLWPYVNKDEDKQKTYQNIPPLMCERYLAIDVYGLKLLTPIIQKELKNEKIFEHFMTTKMKALRIMTNVEYTGVKADRENIAAVNDILTEKVTTLIDKARKYTKIDDFNMGSPKQVNEFFVKHKFPLEKLGIKKTKTGYSTGKEELQKFLKYKKYRTLPEIILEYKTLTKLAGTYVEGKIGDDVDGGMLKHLDQNDRIHASFNLWSPRTGRYSCRKPSLQVWPRPIKGLPNIRNFIRSTSEDWVLFEADYKALEQFVVAVLSKDPVLTKRLQDGTDIHTYNAVELGKKLGTMPDTVSYEHMLCMVKDLEETSFSSTEYENLRKEAQKLAPDFDWKEKRTQAKTIGFGLNYGKGEHSFAEDFGISEDDAEDMIEAYFKIYKGMKKWRDKTVEQALEYGYVSLLSGRKRRFTQATDWINSRYAEDVWQARKLKEEVSRAAMNFPVQGGAHEVFEPAKIRLIQRIKKEGMKARLLLSIHDGIVGECPRDELEKINQILSEELPVKFNVGTPYELNLDIDKDFYESHWYGPKIKL